MSEDGRSGRPPEEGHPAMNRGSSTGKEHESTRHASSRYDSYRRHDAHDSRYQPPQEGRRSRGYSTGDQYNRRRRDDVEEGDPQFGRSWSHGSRDDRSYDERKEGEGRNRYSSSDRSRHHEDHGHERYGSYRSEQSQGRESDRKGFQGRHDDYYGPSHRYGASDGREAHSFHSNSQGGTRAEPHGRDLRRRSRSRSESPERHSRREKMAKWPPCFDEDGSAFVFHPSSGTFYEEKSDFYYDPKTKLYFGVKKAAYFRYDKTKEEKFVEVQKADPAQGTPTNPVDQALTQPMTLTQLQSSSQKSTIAIKLKTKKMKKPKPAEPSTDESSVTNPGPTSKAQKAQVANIEKWTEKQAELKADAKGLEATPVKRTTKGEPMCVLCKRKFQSVEKLRLHEKASQLHKQNLAALATSGATKRKDPPEYYDRAQKRRDLHGPQVPSAAPDRGIAQVPVTEDVDPKQTLGEDNIGNKLLQKMGWESGGSLGRNPGNTTADDPNENIRKDWERIEAVARGPSDWKHGDRGSAEP